VATVIDSCGSLMVRFSPDGLVMMPVDDASL
jgi:hypothetical protein